MNIIEILEKLGAGVSGDLYRARDGLGRDVAVKLIRASGGDADFALKQAQALARSAHPNVVTVHGISEVEDPIAKTRVPAIVMELIPGRTLKEVLRLPSLSADECKR